MAAKFFEIVVYGSFNLLCLLQSYDVINELVQIRLMFFLKEK